MRIFLIAAWALTLLSVVPAAARPKATPDAPAEAAITQPMNVSIVRATTAGCEPNCDEWIAMQGRIETGSPALLRKVLKQMGTRKLPVLIHSPGGQVEAAIEMGKMIREAGLNVIVSRTRYFPACQPENRPCAKAGRGVALRGEPDEARAFCVSACPLVLASGIKRYVAYNAFVGVHQVSATLTRITIHRLYSVTRRREGNRIYEVSRRLVRESTSSNTIKLKKAPASVNDKIARHLKDMGIGEGVMTLLLATPNIDVHYFTRAELSSTNMATELRGVREAFAAPLKTPGTAVPVPQAALPSRPDAMTVAIVRSAASGCVPACTEWIAMNGIIARETPTLLRDVLRKLNGRQLPVLIHSGGGDIDAAFALGKMLRKAELSVGVAKTILAESCGAGDLSCTTIDKTIIGEPQEAVSFCNSACPLVLAGGVRRFVPKDAVLGVHQARTEAADKPVGEAIYERIASYLAEMGVSGELVTLARATPPSGVRYLTRREISSTALATDRADWKEMFAALAPKLVVAIPQLAAIPLPQPSPSISLTALATKPEVVSSGPPTGIKLHDYRKIGPFGGKDYLVYFTLTSVPGEVALKIGAELFDGTNLVVPQNIELDLVTPNGTVIRLSQRSADPAAGLVGEIYPLLVCNMPLQEKLVLRLEPKLADKALAPAILELPAQNWPPLVRLREVLCVG